MRTSIAIKRYLERHIEPALPELASGAGPWQQVLVIPAYDESPGLLDKLACFHRGADRLLIILVLNRPDWSEDALGNQPLREAVGRLPKAPVGGPTISTLSDNTCLYLYDMERLRGLTPSTEGVGLARKIGCDIALYWQSRGHIESQWICTSDADAGLPGDYFKRLAAVANNTAAVVFPFVHIAGDNRAANNATALYELRLHHYVLGLEYAASPYAYHTLGSTLAIGRDHYAQVRGFPKRAGGEDFYLLNKVAKTGSIARLQGRCITLECRLSGRVPFGTGPAVNNIVQGGELASQTLFYHPQCFEALRAWLTVMPLMATLPIDQLLQALNDCSLPGPLAAASRDALIAMGLEAAVVHCRRQGKSREQFLRQFHQWFDGFRTLKFIHALRESGWPDQSLTSLPDLAPGLWPDPGCEQCDIESLRHAIAKHRGWTTDQW